MVGFEVYCNDKKLCTAGIGEHGVMSAHLTWVFRSPELLGMMAARGITDAEKTELSLSVGGTVRQDEEKSD